LTEIHFLLYSFSPIHLFIFLEASLHLVGSSCNGFAGAKSDADFCVMLTQNRSVGWWFHFCISLIIFITSQSKYNW